MKKELNSNLRGHFEVLFGLHRYLHFMHKVIEEILTLEMWLKNPPSVFQMVLPKSPITNLFSTKDQAKKLS
jgi:hypothetical protein